MSAEIPDDLIKQVRIAVLKEASLSLYDPDDASIPNLPSFESSISELDPSPPYLRCKHCKGRLLRGVISLICVFCGKEQVQQETAPEPINFKSTFGCRWFLQSLALDGSEIAGVAVKANELNRGQRTGQEEFPLSDILDLEIKWQPELEKIESESDKSPLHLVGINLDNFSTEGEKDTVSEQPFVEDQIDDGSEDHDFQVRDNPSSFENVKNFEPAVSSTEDVSGGGSFEGWEASFQSADDGNTQEESKLDYPVAGLSVDLSAHVDAVFGSENTSSSAAKTNDWLQDDLWRSSNTEKLGKSNQDVTSTTEDVGTGLDVNNSSSLSINFIQDAQWKSESNISPDDKIIQDEDDSFDAWNDFASSTTFENPTNICEAEQFKVTAIVEDGGEVEKANNSSSRAVNLVQGDQQQTDNIEIPDNKVVNEEDDSFDAWNDFASSDSVQDTFYRQTGQAKQFEVNVNIKDSEIKDAKNSSFMNVDWFQDDQWQTTSKKALDNKNVEVDDDPFDTWNDFTSSASAQNTSKKQSGQDMPFEVTTTIKDDRMVGNANNPTSIAWIQDDLWPINSNKTPDSKIIDQGNDLFDTWNDLIGSTSMQDFPNQQTDPAKQSEITATVKEVNNSSLDWFQVDQGQTSRSKVPDDKATEEDRDPFDAWNVFTSSTSAQDPFVKQSVNHVASSVQQTSEVKFIGSGNNLNDDFGSFSQAQFFSGILSDQNGCKEVDIMQSEPSVSKSMPDVNATNGGNAREAAKSENVSNTTDDVEMLMSKMHDLSFMLASNLLVPSKQDEFGSFSKH